MKLRPAIFLLLVLAISLGSTAQPSKAVPADSVSPTPWPGIAAGGAMLGSAAASRWAFPRQGRVIASGESPDRATGILQYAPLAFPWVMKALGQPTRSGWGRMAVSQALATGLMAASVQGLKKGVGSRRPDGTDRRSFPSGHSAWAFMGATMVAKELGWRSPWYSFGAYTLATGIAVERVIDHHHYPTDVVAGAGIGILATELGYLIGDLIFGRSQLRISGADLRPNNNFSYLSLEMGLSLPMGKIYAGDTEIERMPALSAAMRGAWAASDHWGLAVELGLLSTPLNVDVGGDRTYVKSLSSLGVVILPFYFCSLSDRVSLNAEAGAGYRRNFALNVIDDAVRTGPGTPVGRVAAGCAIRLSPRFSARASIGYEIARYRFDVSPSEAFSITTPASVSGTSSSLLLNISSRYEF